MSRTQSVHTPASSHHSLAFVVSQAASAVRRFLVSGTKRQQISELIHMDDAMLRDIGLTRGDVVEAASAPFGRDPGEVLKQRRRERLNRHGKIDPLVRIRRCKEEFGRRERLLPSSLTGPHWSS